MCLIPHSVAKLPLWNGLNIASWRQSTLCIPGRREERTQAFGLSSGLCVSAAPDASASPSPAPGGAGWPSVFASPGTPTVQRQMPVSMVAKCSLTSAIWQCRGWLRDLFLLPHNLQFLCELDLSLSLRFLGSTTQLFPVFVSKGVESCSSITYLSQLILQPLVVHWQQHEWWDNLEPGHAGWRRCTGTHINSHHSHRFSSSWLRMSSSWGCMLLMDWKSESTALSLVMLRPRMWLLFMRLRKVVTAFCSAFRNCSWFSSDSPFWYCC